MIYVHILSTIFGTATVVRIILVFISGWKDQKLDFYCDSGVSILSLTTDVLEFVFPKSRYLSVASFLLAIIRVILCAYPFLVYIII